MRWVVGVRVTVAITLLGLCPAAVRCREIVATHLAFEKPVKMNRAVATMYASVEDQTRSSAAPGESGSLDCRVVARGRKGRLGVSGDLTLRLLASRAGEDSDAWESRPLEAELDENGEASFSAEDLIDLTVSAAASGVVPDLYRVDFGGGRGGRMTELAIDCLHLAGTGDR